MNRDALVSEVSKTPPIGEGTAAMPACFFSILFRAFMPRLVS
jgi:hypothetical protein